jgi:hypothetical protein
VIPSSLKEEGTDGVVVPKDMVDYVVVEASSSSFHKKPEVIEVVSKKIQSMPVSSVPAKEHATILITKSLIPSKKVKLSSGVSQHKEITIKGESLIASSSSSGLKDAIFHSPTRVMENPTYIITPDVASPLTETKSDTKLSESEADASFEPSDSQLTACEDKEEGVTCEAKDMNDFQIVGTCKVTSEFFSCVP